MGGIPLDTAAIMSTVLEGILYGYSVLMFIGTIWSLTHKRRMQDVNRPIAAVAILLLILSTMHVIVDIIRLEDGLVKYRDTFPKGPAAFFADVTQETYVAKNAIYILQTLLADGVVIYRCYVVWQSIPVIILPSMLWCSAAVTGFNGLYMASQATSDSGNIFAKATGQWITAFFSSTLATNLLSSGLLAYRIWTIERNVSKIRASSHGTRTPILRVLVDAAILYSVVLFTMLICFVCSNNGQYIVLDMIMPIISIAFYMVLIRIAISKKSQSYVSTVHGKTTDMERGNPRHHPMKPLEVRISQFIHNDGVPSHEVDNQERSSTCKVEYVEEASYSV